MGLYPSWKIREEEIQELWDSSPHLIQGGHRKMWVWFDGCVFFYPSDHEVVQIL